MSAERCLVTGASGFIGGRLSERLLQEGYRVRCLVRSGSDTSRLERLDAQLAVGDLGDPASLAAAAAGCDFVLHCAALVSDWATTAEIFDANVQGTRNLFAASASARRLVHFSTTDVYGHPGVAGVGEEQPATGTGNWYARTKLLAEREVRGALAGSVILRPATVYGPGSIEVVGAIARALSNGSMLLVDRGRAVAGLCYVENLLDAAVLALRHEAAAGQTFNVSDGLGVTWRTFTDDLADGLGCRRARFSLPYAPATAIGTALECSYRLLRRATGLQLPPLLSRQAVQVLGRDQDFSSRRLRERLGWQPRVDYEAGLAATLAWLRRPQPEPAGLTPATA
jgi:nucleoside-diphosphate-sugar epimerase